MFLSVIIPTYNYRCYTLVADLQRQLEAVGEPYEIIVAEDGSKDQVTIIANHKIIDLPNCRHLIRKENVGRAAIRNFLVSEAKGEWLLFMDSDARVISSDYISTYINAIKEAAGHQIIIGGLRHTDRLPSPEVSLRYYYEKEADQHRSAAERQQHPFQHLTTFNMCVLRSVMMNTPFDEDCREYGYEDALLGVTLKNKGVSVMHIDNPLEHTGLEPNKKYLAKVETALHTLHSLGDKMVPHSHVGQAAEKARKWFLSLPIIMLLHILRPLLRHNLLSEKPNLKVLAFYKLGYFLSL
ncbi:MAG: glycosyltransferase family 2 protein [Prevotella sp.]|nr:glycosyltransferase family 2 protein [Candidatus Prevotella equi]